VQHDSPGAVEAAGLVAVDFAALPRFTRPRLPDQWRIGGVDADALDRAVELQHYCAAGHAFTERDQERVTRNRHRRERGKRRAEVQPIGLIDLLVATERLGGDRLHRAADDV